jgi:hypothetical protein
MDSNLNNKLDKTLDEIVNSQEARNKRQGKDHATADW